MWTVIKIDKKKQNFFKNEITKKLGSDIILYSPKIYIQNYKNNKLIDKKIDLLGDYIFCFHNDFKNPKILNKLKFVKGLKYFLDGFIKSQKEIENFISKCKNSENNQGYLTKNIFNLYKDREYKFFSGPFTNMIFKIINIQKKKMEILIGNVKTVTNNDENCFQPI